MSSNDIQTNFPLGYAESFEVVEGNSISYLGWLQNDLEFPALNTSAVEDSWEALHIDDTEMFVEMQMEDDWTKINRTLSYAQIAEKNSSIAKQQSCRQTAQTLWYSDCKNKERYPNIHCANVEDPFDFTLLFDMRKSRGKNALRSGHLRKVRSLRVLENCCYYDILRVGTSRYSGPINHPANELMTGYGYRLRWLQSKGEALKFAANFSFSKDYYYIDKTIGHRIDYTEFSINEPIKERRNISCYSLATHTE